MPDGLQEQIQNQRDNAERLGDEATVKKFDRLLEAFPKPQTPAEKRAAAAEDKKTPPAARTKPERQTRA